MKQAIVPGKMVRNTYVTIAIRALLAAVLLVLFSDGTVAANDPVFKVLAFYSRDVEPDHLHSANDALAFYRDLAAKNNFVLDATTDWSKLNEKDLKPADPVAEQFPAISGAEGSVRKVHGSRRWLDRVSRCRLQTMKRQNGTWNKIGPRIQEM